MEANSASAITDVAHNATDLRQTPRVQLSVLTRSQHTALYSATSREPARVDHRTSYPIAGRVHSGTYASTASSLSRTACNPPELKLAPWPWNNPFLRPCVYIESSPPESSQDPGVTRFCISGDLAARASPLWASAIYGSRPITLNLGSLAMLGFGEPNTTDIGKGTGRQPRPVSNHHPSVTITVENCSAQTLEAVLSYCLAQTASNPNFAKMDNASIFAVLEVALSQHVQPALNLLLDFLRTRPWRDSYWWQRECWKRSWWDGLAACLQQQHTLAVRRLDAKSPGEVPPWKSAADAYSGACSHALRFNLVLYKRCDDRGAFYLPWLRPPARDAVASACPHGTRPYEETYNVFFADDSQGRVRRWFIHALVALQEHLIEYPSLATLKTCSILYDFAADACGLCKGKALVETERYTSDIGQLVEDVLSQVPFPNHLVIPHSPLPDLPSAETEAHPLISVPRMWL